MFIYERVFTMLKLINKIIAKKREIISENPFLLIVLLNVILI